MRIVTMLVISSLSVCALAATNASAISLAVTPRSVEAGDVVTLQLSGKAHRCTITVGPLGSKHFDTRWRNVSKLQIPISSATQPGTYVASARCAARRTQARFFVHAPAGPDFAFALTPGRTSRRGQEPTRVYTVGVTNLAPWVASTVRLCVTLHGDGKITATDYPGSRESGSSTCGIFASVGPGQTTGFKIRVQRAARHRALTVTASASGGNSTGASRRWHLGSGVRSASLGEAKGEHDRPSQRIVAPRARALVRARAATTTAACTSASRIGVAFVADDSGSMTENDPDQLRGQAISVGLDELPDGSLAGATRFADESSVLFGVTEVNPSSRPTMKSLLGGLASEGNTDYEQAFEGAQAQLAEMGSADRKAVVFLSDGLPSYPGYTADQAIASSGVPINTIGLGSADEGVLEAIAAESGGQSYRAESAADLQSIYAHIVASLTCSAANVSTALDIAPGEVQSVPFAVSPEDGEFRALAAWSGGHLSVTAVRPDGSSLSPSSLRGGEAFSDNPTYALLTGTNPEVGGWSLRIASDVGNAGNVHVSIDVFKKNLPALAPSPPLVTKTQGRSLDPCIALYGGGKRRTKKIFGGEQTDYDRTESLFDVCGGFGSPASLVWPLGMKCAFISAVTVLAGGELADPSLVALDHVCGATDTLTDLASGNWAGAAGGLACNTFANLFSEGVGILAAGAAAESGPGAAFVGDRVYRFFNAGLKLACGGIFGGGAAAVGAKLEADHETAIARDVASSGKCLRFTKRFGWVSWSAATCTI